MPLFSLPARGARALMLRDAQQRAPHMNRRLRRETLQGERESERELETKRTVRAAEKARDALPALSEIAR